MTTIHFASSATHAKCNDNDDVDDNDDGDDDGDVLLVQTWTSVVWTMPDVLSCATTPTARSAAAVTPATDLNTIDDHASVSRKRLVSQRH